MNHGISVPPPATWQEMRGPLLRKGGVRGAADQGLQLRFAAGAEGHLLAGPVVNPGPTCQYTLQFQTSQFHRLDFAF